LNLERDHQFNAEPKAKKLKTYATADSCNEEVSSSLSSANGSILLDIQKDLSEIRNEITGLKKIVGKLYTSHKRSSNNDKVRYCRRS